MIARGQYLFVQLNLLVYFMQHIHSPYLCFFNMAVKEIKKNDKRKRKKRTCASPFLFLPYLTRLLDKKMGA